MKTCKRSWALAGHRRLQHHRFRFQIDHAVISKTSPLKFHRPERIHYSAACLHKFCRWLQALRGRYIQESRELNKHRSKSSLQIVEIHTNPNTGTSKPKGWEIPWNSYMLVCCFEEPQLRISPVASRSASGQRRQWARRLLLALERRQLGALRGFGDARQAQAPRPVCIQWSLLESMVPSEGLMQPLDFKLRPSTRSARLQDASP